MDLKQSTSVVISLGPFLDKTDGVTLETGLVSALDHASTGILLSKNGGTLTIRHATVTASTYDAHGCYKVTLDTTDTGTLGTLRAIYTDAATCLPVWMDFNILPAAMWNSLYATSGGNLPNAAAEAAGGLYTRGTGAGQVNQDANEQTHRDIAPTGSTLVCQVFALYLLGVVLHQYVKHTAHKEREHGQYVRPGADRRRHQSDHHQRGDDARGELQCAADEAVRHFEPLGQRHPQISQARRQGTDPYDQQEIGHLSSAGGSTAWVRQS